MSRQFARWFPAGPRCSGKAQPGARALMAAILVVWPGTKSWGIYSCRPTALGNPSAHGEGRALDIGCSLDVGRDLVRDLRRIEPWKLGISVIIHDRVLYSEKSPNGRRYNGHPHRDHVHIEMTPKASRNLSLARAKRVLVNGR